MSSAVLEPDAAGGLGAAVLFAALIGAVPERV